MKDVTGYVAPHQGHFYVDSYDIESGGSIADPQDEICWVQDGQRFEGVVSDEARGRDDDVYKINITAIVHV